MASKWTNPTTHTDRICGTGGRNSSPISRQETVIERLTGDGDARTLIAPLWSRNKRSVLNAIASYQKTHDLYQGMRCSSQ